MTDQSKATTDLTCPENVSKKSDNLNMTTDMPELLPCPFCKCRVEMEFDGDDLGYEHGGSWESISITGQHTDLCPFGQTVDNGIGYDGCNYNPDEIAAAWNNRADLVPAAPTEISVRKNAENETQNNLCTVDETQSDKDAALSEIDRLTDDICRIVLTKNKLGIADTRQSVRRLCQDIYSIAEIALRQDDSDLVKAFIDFTHGFITKDQAIAAIEKHRGQE